MSSNEPLHFYDIAMRAPIEETCCSPNPWKARYALNFKGVPYHTTWVNLPEIANVRKGLKVPPVRKFADGSDYFTLPILQDPSTEASVGDSFDIAAYLQETYPEAGSGDLFPEQALDFDYPIDPNLLVPLSDMRESRFREYAKFNVHADAAFTAHVALGVQGMPFEPAHEEETRAIFVSRAKPFGLTRWEDFGVEGEARAKMKESLREMLGSLSKLFLRDASGPFILGARATYADIIVGGWLRMFKVTLPEGEWEEITGWHDGLFARLYEGLDQAFGQVE